jgi:hypothetical protein
VRGEQEQFLPEVFLELPQIGGLAGEGSAVHAPEGGEPLRVVPSEVAIDGLVGVDAEELSDHFDGENLCIGEPWRGTALADATPFEPVVYKAEDSDDEAAKIHKKETSATSSGAIESTPSVGRSSPWLNSSRETCTSG